MGISSRDTGLNYHVSVDCVVFGFEFGKLNALLIEREMQFEGSTYTDLKLPGDLVRTDEDLDTAAARVLKELTGLENIYLKQYAAIGTPNRLTRLERDMEWLRQIGHPEKVVVTVAYYSLINIDQDKINKFQLQKNARWQAVSQISELAFDHLEILNEALQTLRTELRSNPIGFELLPNKFTLSQLQKLYEVILGVSFDKRNFRKKVTNMPYIVPINEKERGVSHKPARYYIFSKKIYEKTRKNSLDFSM
ncbi:MAG TPA: NUDIX domain-containing protein [Lentimicrobium sp.]|jgi:ADP-ribose pyrophosphatase YjhB (NUDIX family)|nr:NUDIX domain-containing protein [Lentimicrobium sp.]